jgi:hypothetical protein
MYICSFGLQDFFNLENEFDEITKKKEGGGYVSQAEYFFHEKLSQN